MNIENVYCENSIKPVISIDNIAQQQDRIFIIFIDYLFI